MIKVLANGTVRKIIPKKLVKAERYASGDAGNKSGVFMIVYE